MIAEEIYWRLPRQKQRIPKTIFVTVNSKGSQTCPHCGGTKKEPCPNCKGEGKLDCPQCGGDGTDAKGQGCGTCQGQGTVPCDQCGGSGNTGKDCPTCGGTGVLSNNPIILPREELDGAIDKLVRETTGQSLQEMRDAQQTRDHGHTPGIWGTIYKSIKSDEIDWQTSIIKFLASFRDKLVRTLKKPSRRFPSPWGRRKEYRPKLTAVVDCSGSIANLELEGRVIISKTRSGRSNVPTVEVRLIG